MANIYVNDSVISTFPKFSHPLTPPLFIEKGTMPCHDQKKAKKAIFYINICGVYFLRPIKLTKFYKLSQFIPIFSITEISYVDPTKRRIVTKGRSLYIQCEHCDQAVSQILSARKIIYQDITEPFKTKITGFPIEPTIPETFPTGNCSITALRYISFCARFFRTPDENMIKVLNNYDPAHCSVITFDETCIAPDTLKCICIPLLQLKGLTTIHFKNYAPFCVARIVHNIIKHSYRISTFIFEDYSTIVPEQLRFVKTRGRGVLSLVFKNCHFQESTAEKIFQQLGEYPGEIQRLSLIRFDLTAHSWKVLFDTITHSRPFMTLEVLEIEQIDSRAFYDEQVSETISSLLRHCRFVLKLSVSSWTQPIHFGLNNFVNCSLLSEVVLCDQDMTQPLPDDFRMLRMIHHLDLSRCDFTFMSLKSLFRAISAHPARVPISLVLADIKLPESHWHNLYSNLDSFPPIQCIRDLNWSGNLIESDYIQQFANFFLNTQCLRFLTLDRCFSSQQVDELRQLLSYIPQGRLFGISIGGSTERNFGGNINALLDALNTLSDLHFLHLNAQRLSDVDTTAVFDFVSRNTSLVEVSFDETNISDQNRFYEFYHNLCNISTLESVARPLNDIVRLFGRKLTNVMNPSAYEQFASEIRTKNDMMTPTCRGFFYCKFDSCTKFDAHRYDSFTQRFPAAYFYLDRIDYFGLKRENAKRPLPSLTAVNLRHAIKHLSDIHKRYLSDPERIPRYRASSSVLLPWSPGSAFSDTSDSTANYAFMNQGYGNEEDFSTTTGFGFGNQFYETMGPNTAFFATSEFDIGTGMMDSLEPLQPIDSDNQFMFTPDGDDFLLAPDGAVEIEAPQFFTDLPPPPEEEKKVEPPAPEPQNNFGAPFESLEPLQPLEPLELTPMEPLQPLDQMGLAPLEPLDPMPFNPDLVPLEPLQPLQSLDPPTSTVNVNQTTVTTTTTVTREVNVIQQQQQTNVEISLKENRNFMNTLNQYASNEVFEPTPEMPEIDDSQVVSRNVQQPSEVTEVKPLLTSTVKGRNRSIGPAMDAPPEMISLSIPPPVVNSTTTTTTTTTTNNVQMTIPPPVQGLVIPPPQQKPPMTIPPPVVPQMRISQPPPFLQANQPPSPAPQPTPPPVSEPPKIATNQIIIVPPVVKQPEPAKPPEQPHPEPQFKTTITTNVYEVKQDTKQVEEKSQVQPGPQPPKLEAKPYVQVQPQPWPAPPPKPAGPGIQVGVGAPSPTPISIPPPPGVVTSQQYIPSSKDVNLPKSPARAPMPKKHIPKFPSSAGSLNLLQIPGAGHANVQPTKRSVKLTDGSVVQIEEPHKLTLPTNESIPRPQPFDDIDIDDISALSKNAVSAETPKLATIEPVNNSASFYESNDLPFALLKPSSGIKIGNMSHPLQQRRIVPPPTIRILGVPSEW